MKRLLCFILIFCLLIPLASASEGEMTLSVSEVIGGVGDTVTVTCRLTGAPACSSFRIILPYDQACLKPLSGALGASLSGQTGLNTAATYQDQSAVVAVAANSGPVLSGDQELFTVEFEILAAPESGSVLSLNIAHQEFFSTDLARLRPIVANGAVYLNTYLPGDIDLDGQVDLLDAVLLLRKLSGNLPADAPFFLLAADVIDTGDCEVNSADVARMLQYITGVREDGAVVPLQRVTVVPSINI